MGGFGIIALKSIAVYVFIVAAIRLFGKKEFAQLSALDLAMMRSLEIFLWYQEIIRKVVIFFREIPPKLVYLYTLLGCL